MSMNKYEVVATIEAKSLLEIGRALNIDNLQVRTLSIARLNEDEDEECTDWNTTLDLAKST